MMDIASSMRTPTARLALIGAKVVVSAILMYWLFTTLSANADWPTFTDGNVVLLSLCLPVELAKLWVLAKRWQLVSSTLSWDESRGLSFWRYLSLTWIGQAISQVLPALVGGDGFRIAALHYDRIPLRIATQSVIVDRVIGLVGLAILMTVGWFVAGSLGITALSATVAGVIAVIAAGSYVLPRRLGLAMTPASSARLTFLLLLLAVLGHALSVVTFLLAASAYGQDIRWVAGFAGFPAALLFSMLPVAFGGWGVREAAAVYGLSLYGVDKHAALLASVLFGIVQAIVSVPSVVFFFLPKKRVNK